MGERGGPNGSERDELEERARGGAVGMWTGRATGGKGRTDGEGAKERRSDGSYAKMSELGCGKTDAKPKRATAV